MTTRTRNILISVGVNNGENITLAMQRSTVDRLRNTCFRGREVAKAGNFFAWDNFRGLAVDLLPNLGPMITRRIEELAAQPDKKQFKTRFELEHEQEVGWPCTDDRSKYAEHELETYRPNCRTKALRVRRDSGRFAPQTRTLTMACEVHHNMEKHNWFVLVYTVYPGKDFGLLQGTFRDIVFFDWGHPGELDPAISRIRETAGSSRRVSRRP